MNPLVMAPTVTAHPAIRIASAIGIAARSAATNKPTAAVNQKNVFKLNWNRRVIRAL
jgi:hypothetical protein